MVKSGKDLDFVKVFLPEFSSHELVIPPAFIDLLEKPLPKEASLLDENGRLWCVETKTQDTEERFSVLFSKGWDSFANDLSLKFGDFLVFSFDGDSRFSVTIFAIDGCKKDLGVVTATDKSRVSVDKEPVAKPVRCFTKPDHRKDRGKRVKRKRRCDLVDDEPKCVPTIKTEPKYQDGDKGFEEAVYKPKNPHFVRTINDSSLRRLDIPTTFLKSNGIDLEEDIELCDENGKRWPFKTVSYNRGVCFSRESWLFFCKSHKMKKTNKCLFEFTVSRSNGRCNEIHVRIFGARLVTTVTKTGYHVLAICSHTTSFWNQSEKQKDSWNWRCLLRLRVLAEKFIKCEVGNGRTTSFWFDNWTPYGPLFSFIGSDGPSSLRVPLNAIVSDACDSNGWHIANPRSDHALRLHIYLTGSTLLSDDLGSDSFTWYVDESPCNGFSSSKTWSAIRPRADPVDWFSCVWFKGATPKHAFTMWTANLNRLPTKDRLVRWGMQIDTTCGLCSTHVESRDHLFLSCDFALFLWHAVSLRLNLAPFNFGSWPDLLSWTKVRNITSPPTLRKLVAHSIIYAIWKQRNNLLHNHDSILPSVIFKAIDREIKNSITARRLRKRFKNLLQLWLH